MLAEADLHRIAGIPVILVRRPVDALAFGLEFSRGLVDRADEELVRNLLQALDFLLRNLKLAKKLLCIFFRIRLEILSARNVSHDAAHDDRLLEETVRVGCLSERRDLSAAARLTEDRHVLRIAAESRDVFLHPFQGGHEIRNAHVHGILILLAVHGEIQMSEGIQTVVNGDEHDAVVFREAVAFIGHVLDGGTGRIAAAVEPDHDRLLCRRVNRIRPHIQVLAMLRLRPEAVRADNLLARHGRHKNRADQSVGQRVLHAFPRIRLFRHLEAFRLGVLDAEEIENAVVDIAADLSLLRLYDRIVFGTLIDTVHVTCPPDYYRFILYRSDSQTDASHPFFTLRAYIPPSAVSPPFTLKPTAGIITIPACIMPAVSGINIGL